jgi:hypothetical protein
MFAAGFRCGPPVEATLGQPFELKYGQAASIPSEKITVTFVAVAEDSRCPKGEQCITAGKARIVLEVAVGSAAPERAELTLGRGESDAVVAGLEVTLLGLEPYPVSGRPAPTENYLAKLSLRRL